MAAVVTPPQIITGSARSHLRLVQPDERAPRADAATPVEPLFSPQAVVVAMALSLLLVVGALAVGRGDFAGLAPDGPASASATAAPAGQAVGSTVVVRPGDTIWSIARGLQPEGDIRPLVDRLVAAHGSTAVSPGDRISLEG